MCCGDALWEPAEEQIRGWLASGFVVEEAAPDETSDGAAWRVVIREPGRFSFATSVDARLARELFAAAPPG